MDSFISTYFGPVDPRMCNYFLGASIVGLITCAVSILICIKLIIKPTGKKMSSTILANSVLFGLNGVFFYFSNRIFYNMCKASAGHRALN